MLPSLRSFRVFLSLFVVAAGCADAAVTVSQDTITLKTWSEGLPDTNPWFELLAGNNYAVYPYTMRTNFGPSTSNVAWRELTLENEYLFCRVFPDLGGHLYSCKDKINNVEMFYANPVIRKGYVGLRGAWVALGIELNFPVGHSLVSISPVNFGAQQNPDGSGGVWVADVDRQTGMEWRVEFVLRPGSAMLEQNVWLYNRGEVRQPYYWWSNSEEIEGDQNDAFVLPTNVSGSHGFTFLDTWPISQAGVDMSVIKNYSSGLGLFAYGSNEPFIAAYHPSTKTGTAHYADPAIMPGKKLWTWGTSPAFGDAWVQANLTENFPSYIETQAGVTPNQETRLWLDPQQSSHFTEYWMPARGLDGISRANSKGVLYLGRTTVNSQPALEIELNATQSMSGATIRILNGATPAVPDTIVNLDPAVTYQQTVTGIVSNVNYTFQLLDSGGNILLAHTENQYNGVKASDVTLGNQPPTDFGTSGTEPYFLAYTAYGEMYRGYSFAEHYYDTGLATVTGSVALRKGSGRLAYLAARYDDAATLLAQVVAQTPDDHEAHYYLGLAYAALGRNNAAVSEWSGIQSTTDFGAAATFELACLRALTGDLPTAANLFDSVNTVRAGALEIAVLRRQGNTSGASAKLAQWRAVSPTDFFLRNEATLLGTPDSTLSTDLGAEPERVLNVVDDYLRLGAFNDALALLNQVYPTNLPATQMEPGALPPQNNALIAYYRGYCRQQLGGSPAADFNAASAMPLQYIFPNRASSFAVLRAAVSANGNDANAHYLLGLLYMSVLQIDNAIAEWQTARSLNKTLPALHRNLGRAYLDVKGDPNTALPILTEGLTYEPSNSDLQDAYDRAHTASQNNSSCPFTLTSPASLSIGPNATEVSVSFAGSSSCSWSATGYDGWISNASSQQGQGPATVLFVVRANSSLSARSQTLIVAGQPVTITQSGATCSYSLTGSSATAPAAGGTITVGVVSPSDACVWTASTMASWITLTSGANGDGGAVAITAAPYTGSFRSGVVTIAGNTFNVNQGSPATTYTICGQVTFSGAGLAGVSIVLSGSQTGSAITDSAGSYSFSGLASGSYTVIPSSNVYTFNPPTQTFNNLSANQTATFVAGTGTASFVRTDTTTQGNWIGTYGADGYIVANDSISLPVYAGVSLGSTPAYTWTGATTDVRALQRGSSAAGRVASAYYTSGSNSFNIDVNVSDGQTHQIAVYAVDWDNLNRTETVSVVDAGSQAVLDTRSLAVFANGTYLVWNVSGHVLIRVALTGGLNAVVSGIFFKSSGTTPIGSATFVQTDTATHGNWKGSYGQDGYVIANDLTKLPSYADVTFGSTRTYTWAASTNDVRALLKGSSTTDRIASTYYTTSGNLFTIDVNVTDGQTHQLAVYTLDYDNVGRAETVSILDAGTEALLDSRSLSSFSNGTYLVWNVSGHVLIRVTLTGGITTAINGLFFKAATVPAPDLTIAKTHTGNFAKGQIGATYRISVANVGTLPTSGTVTVTDTVPVGLSATAISGSGWNCTGPAGPCSRSDALSAGSSYPAITLNVNVASNAPTAVTNTAVVSGGGETNSSNNTARDPTTITPTTTSTAAFITTDKATQGNWRGKYGQDGYIIANDSNNPPPYAGVSFGSAPIYTWIASTTDVRALLKGSSTTDRIASTYYTSGSNTFNIDINLSDGQTHQVALYVVDWDKLGRAQTISILDAGNQAVLDSRSVTSFTSGAYLVWNVSGHVLIRVTLTGGLNALVSGVFFTSSAAGPSAAFVRTDTTTQGNWKGAYGQGGYFIANDSISPASYATVTFGGSSTYTWAASTTDARAPLKGGSTTDRIASTYFTSGSNNFTIDVKVTDGKTHQVALYPLDFDSQSRAESISILDAGTQAVLDTRSIVNFTNGAYLVWNVSGHVTIRVTLTGGLNAVVSGVFLGL
jgi:tetratricopeptide (TPR) repeat protein